MTVLTVRHRAWSAPETTAALPTAGEHGRGLTLTDRAVFRDGVPIVPVSGELHYSRMPRARWAERLRQLRALGVTVASTYVFWNHHVAERGRPRFDGDLDVAAFVDDVESAGLELVLRIGPWAHGEARHGGFPDWVQDAGVHHRTDDPAYLALVREWFGQLAGALDGRARPGGPIIGIQVENELYDRPEHLRTLIDLAREAGMSAPLWTATAWGGAQLPPGEVVPLFGGYADGFWVDPDGGWQPNFRAHFFASHDWDDPGVGEDVRASQGFAADDGPASRRADLHGFPPATCELGSGMATAYHRRPVLAARDVAALAHVKIGNGSAWQGYYMFAGGRNPGRGLQESQDTGYPNDLPELGYDFHAPIGQSGDLHPSAHELRAQHAFLAAFGDRLGRMTSSLPEVLASGLADRTTLRWALRSDGDEAFVFVSHHQPYEQVEPVAGVQLAVGLDAETIVLPSRRVDIPAGTLARWPVGLRLGTGPDAPRVRWVTASAVTLLPGGTGTGGADGDGPTLVVAVTPGVDVEFCVDGEEPRTVGVGRHPLGRGHLLVLADADRVWVRGDDVYETDGELAWDDDAVAVRDATWLRRYDAAVGEWREIAVVGPSPARPVTVAAMRAAAPVPDDHGFGGPRHRAPAAQVLDADAAVFALEPDAWEGDAVLDVDCGGDVAQLRVDGVVVDDRFWDGERWSISLPDVGATPASTVTLHVLPLSVRSTVWLPPRAAARRAAAAPDLLSVDSVSLRTRTPWHPLA
ncbi:beta-galactosidase [Microbacterium sp. PA5]|uniref:beta-galactosidase n=1 Tax=Microbacterium sp. PA5 TaxID=3416654 RepID=UPI003CF01380